MVWDFLKNREKIMREYNEKVYKEEQEAESKERFIDMGFFGKVVEPSLLNGIDAGVFSSYEKESKGSYRIYLKEESEYFDRSYMLIMKYQPYNSYSVTLEDYNTGKAVMWEEKPLDYYNNPIDRIELFSRNLDSMAEQLEKRIADD